MSIRYVRPSAARIGCLAILSACLVSPTLAAELFGPAGVGLPVGAEPVDVAVADLDADGTLDLAVANFEDGTVSVFLGDGLGGFVPASTVDVVDPISIAPGGDLNGDGNLDLLVANFATDTLSVLLGDGQGGFSPAANFPAGPGPRSLAVGDFDLDGHSDVAVANFDANGITILLGTGLGSFVPLSPVGVGDEPKFVLAHDFDEDGVADLAVASSGSNTVEILRGDGDGVFVPISVSDVGLHPIWLVTSDFDTDGHADLAVANRDGDSVTVLRGDGLGGFLSGFEIPLDGSETQSIAVADLNADGADDLIVSHEQSEEVSILLGDGLGRFSQTGTVNLPSPAALRTADLNRDGLDDLVSTAVSDKQLSILLGDGLGTFVRAPRIAMGAFPRSIASGDFDGNGLADFAVANRDSDRVDILLGDGKGGFESIVEIDTPGGPEFVIVADFDEDGNEDLALALRFAKTIRILTGNGDGTFTPGFETGVGNFPKEMASGDLNHDGHEDVVAAIKNQDKIAILLGDGLGGFVKSEVSSAGEDPHAVEVGDIDGDTHPDVVVSNTVSGEVILLRGDGLGGLEVPDPLVDPPLAEGAGPRAILEDLDANGVLDLAVANVDGDTVSIYLGDRSGGFLRHSTFPVGTNPQYQLSGNFNADEHVDLVIVNGRANSLEILLGNGHGDFESTRIAGLGDRPVAVAAGDLDQDGLADLVVANRGSNDVNILLNRLLDRADVNGSNRIDGFDVALIGKLSAVPSNDPAYRREADVDLNGVIDGDDLALVSLRFGELANAISPLRVSVQDVVPTEPDTVTFQPLTAEGDLLALEIQVNDDDDPVTAADFAVVFGPELEAIGFDPGTFFSGGRFQIYDFDTESPGRAEVSVARLPSQDQVGQGPGLMTLFFRGKLEGMTTLDFAPFRHPEPTLLNSLNQPVPGVVFVGGLTVDVALTGGATTGRIDVSPRNLDFGEVAIGQSTTRQLRILNPGFSEVEVTSITSTRPEFSSFFSSAFTIPPLGSVKLTVEYTASHAAVLTSELVIESTDPQRPQTFVPLSGASGLDVLVEPGRLEFAAVPVNSERTSRIKLTNLGSSTLTLTGLHTSDGRFAPQAGFSILDPGAQGNLDVRFAPGDQALEFHASLTLGFDAPDEKVVLISLFGRGEPDSDGDEVADRLDNCPVLSNSSQDDVDGDGRGDICDTCPNDFFDDGDADGACGDVDNCPTVANGNQTDSDGDLIGDACDNCPMQANSFQAPVKLSASSIAQGDVGTRFEVTGSADPRVIYIADHDTNNVFELYGVPVVGGVPTKLSGPLATGGAVLSFQVSADGSTVVYSATQAGPDFNDLFSVPIAGGTITKLTQDVLVPGGGVLNFAISPDSGTVVYRSDFDALGDIRLYSVSISGGPPTPLNVTLPADGDVLGFLVSPDSATVVYEATQEASNLEDLYSVPIGGGPPTKLSQDVSVPNSGIAGEVAISPDSATVVYRSDFDGLEIQLYSVSISGGGPVKLNGSFPTTGIHDAEVFDFRISPDGSTVVYRANHTDNSLMDLYAVPLTGGTETKLTPEGSSLGTLLNGVKEDWAISTDGSRVVYRSDFEENFVDQLYSVSIAGGAFTQLNGELQSFGDVRLLVVAPNGGSTVVYHADQDTDEVDELYSVPVAGGPETKLNGDFSPDRDVLDFALSPDGSVVVYRADLHANQIFELFAVPIGGFAHETPTKLNGVLVPGGGVEAFDIGPDGAAVVYLADQEIDQMFELFATGLTDRDNDGVGDVCDICPDVPNPCPGTDFNGDRLKSVP